MFPEHAVQKREPHWALDVLEKMLRGGHRRSCRMVRSVWGGARLAGDDRLYE